jgi:3-oxoacyl-[acyl-carrier protein] reductase
MMTHNKNLATGSVQLEDRDYKSNFCGRVVMITGAWGGLGRNLVKAFQQAGAYLVTVDHGSASAGASAFPATGAPSEKISNFEANLSCPGEIYALFEKIWRDVEKVDILINNAGISPKINGKSLPIDELSLDVWNNVLSVNLTAPFLTSKLVLPQMKIAKWGRIINMSSVAGRTMSTVAGSPYAASKAGLIGFTRQLASEVGKFGITANCIAPGRIITPMINTMAPSVNQEYLSRIPVNRLGIPSDITNTALFLASQHSSFLTGTTIDVNGGSFMN